MDASVSFSDPRAIRSQDVQRGRLLRLNENTERGLKHSALSIAVADVAIRTPERVGDRSDARHIQRALKLPNHVQRYRRNPGLFNLAGDQSNGPAAIRSDRGQYDKIDGV